jgi:hypothetical protein
MRSRPALRDLAISPGFVVLLARHIENDWIKFKTYQQPILNRGPIVLQIQGIGRLKVVIVQWNGLGTSQLLGKNPDGYLSEGSRRFSNS